MSSSDHGVLRLRNVLHVPTSLCNVVGGLSTGDYGMYSLEGPVGQPTGGDITDREGFQIRYFDTARYQMTLKFSEPPVGPVLGP
jgi:hypothetical protein